MTGAIDIFLFLLNINHNDFSYLFISLKALFVNHLQTDKNSYMRKTNTSWHFSCFIGLSWLIFFFCSIVWSCQKIFSVSNAHSCSFFKTPHNLREWKKIWLKNLLFHMNNENRERSLNRQFIFCSNYVFFCSVQNSFKILHFQRECMENAWGLVGVVWIFVLYLAVKINSNPQLCEIPIIKPGGREEN